MIDHVIEQTEAVAAAAERLKATVALLQHDPPAPVFSARIILTLDKVHRRLERMADELSLDLPEEEEVPLW